MRLANIIWLALGMIIIAVAGILSLMLSYKFGASYGHGWWNIRLMGGLAAGFDAFKAILTIFAGIALASRMWGRALLALMLYSGLAVLSSVATTSWVLQNRMDTGALKQEKAEVKSEARKSKADLIAERDQIRKKHKPRNVAALDQLIGLACSADSKKLWYYRNGRKMTRVGRREKRKCERLAVEKGYATQIADLNTKISAYKADQVRAVKSGDVASNQDAQLAFIRDLTGFKPKKALTVLAVSFAVFLEIVAGLGGWMISKPLGILIKSLRDDRQFRSMASVSKGKGKKKSKKKKRKSANRQAKAFVKKAVKIVTDDAVVGAGEPVADDKWQISDLLDSAKQAEMAEQVQLAENIAQAVVPAKKGIFRRLVRSSDPAADVGFAVSDRQSDMLSDYLDSRIIAGSGEIKGSAVYADWQSWAGENCSMSHLEFSQAFADLVRVRFGDDAVITMPTGRRFGEQVKYIGLALVSERVTEAA